MSSFERTRMGAGVAIAALVLVLSTVAAHDGHQFIQEKASPSDIESVRRGVAILEGGRSPLIGMQPCDAVKALLPERFTRADGDRKITEATPADVILCFRDSIDYQQGLEGAAARGLTWERGIGGNRIVAFAPNEARFLQVAQINNLTIRPSDLREAEPLLFRLQPHPRAARVKDGWSIQPSGAADEVLFGPYATRPIGRYRILVGFEPETSIPCSAAVQAIHVAVAVTASARTLELAPNQNVTLKPSVSSTGHCLMTGELDFSTSKLLLNIETPISVQSGVLPVRLVQYSLQSAN